MSGKVLCVDDDPKLLNGIERQLGDDFDIDTAEGPDAALELIESSGPFAVVVSDMRMPGMNGVEFLKKVREINSATVRMMLTGFADLKTTMDAVNEGNIYRFLSKPCEARVLGAAIEDGIRQYDLITAEQELVDGTLKGCVKVLSEVLALTSPIAFGRASRLRRSVRMIGEAMGEENVWQLEIAALLSQLGCVSVPAEILEKVFNGEELDEEEKAVFDSHPQTAFDLLQNIPRFEGVAKSILHQSQPFTDQNDPHSGSAFAESLPIGARILKVALDLDAEEQRIGDPVKAVATLKTHAMDYDPDILATAEVVVANFSGVEVKEIRISELKEGMIFAEDVMSTGGQVMVTRGHEVTSSLIKRLKNIGNRIKQPLSVTELRTDSSDTTQFQEIAT